VINGTTVIPNGSRNRKSNLRKREMNEKFVLFLFLLSKPPISSIFQSLLLSKASFDGNGEAGMREK
jgi:hypothetical protein